MTYEAQNFRKSKFATELAREGKSLEGMKTLIKLPKCEKWASYQQWFLLNIEGMYRHVQLHRLQNP